jgi:creatinine amidohydrolase
MSDLKWGAYELLRPAQIEVIRAATPIAYLPWGALEWHSYHNPIGLDGLKARKLCEALAQEIGGVVLPPVYTGTDTIKPFKGFHHTLEHKVETVRALCSEYLEQLADEAFKVIILVTGHYGGKHVEAIKETAAKFAAAHPDVRVWALADWEPHEGYFEPNHAAFGETSYLMFLHPETVDLSLLPVDREATLDEDGVWGEDPRKSSAEAGAKMLAVFVEQALPKIRALLA